MDNRGAASSNAGPSRAGDPVVDATLDVPKTVALEQMMAEMTIDEAKAEQGEPQAQAKGRTEIAGQGVTAFFNFTAPISAEEAREVTIELMTANHTRPVIDPALILAVHEVLCDGGPGNKLGEKLPEGSLRLFLEYCREVVLCVDLGKEPVRAGVQFVLKMVTIANEINGLYT